MSQPPRDPHAVHRHPRLYRSLMPEVFVIPSVTSPSPPQAVTLIVSLFALFGFVLSAVGLVYLNSRPSASQGGNAQSTFVLVFLAASAVTMIGSMVSYVVQARQTVRDAKALGKLYLGTLEQLETTIAERALEEMRAREEYDPPLQSRDIVKREHIWQRRPEHPDFLAIRMGTGRVIPTFEVQSGDRGAAVTLPPRPIRGAKVDFAELIARGDRLAKRYARLKPELHPTETPEKVRQMVGINRDVPVVVSLKAHRSVAIIAQQIDVATHFAAVMMSHLAVHHATSDVLIYILAPFSRASQWNWADLLPHTKRKRYSLIGFHLDNRKKIEADLLDELYRRSQELATRTTSSDQRPIFLPHLVIFVDVFPSNDRSPLETPALALALRRGPELGATVVTLDHAVDQAPAAASLVVKLGQGRSAVLEVAQPNPPAPQTFFLDELSSAKFSEIAHSLHDLVPEIIPDLQMPTQVDLLPLLKLRGNPSTADLQRIWDESRKAMTKGVFVPLGLKLGGEVLSVDLTANGDGPHGLLIGQTGSGKSELLRSFVMALALKYGPDHLNLVLVDYKGGLAFNVYEQLPHTVSLLTNMAQPGQTRRFLSMLRFELRRRQAEIDAGRTPPHLLVVIDEFAEMIAQSDGGENSKEAIVDNLLGIVRLGRQLRVHLLFASQRMESFVMQRLSGYVQYRICLRTNRREDSMEVLGRPDAADLPANTPGRGFLLRGNNELALFQTALLTLPPSSTNTGPQVDAVAPDEELTQRMFGLGRPAKRWPNPLPTPTINNPTPIFLIQPAGGRSRPGSRACPVNRADQYPMLVPIGLYDRPEQQVQDWYLADLHGYHSRITGGPIAFIGDLNSGKTNALQSMLLALARNWGPDDLRIFVLDPSLSFTAFTALPHCAPLAGQAAIIQGGELKEVEDFFTAFKQQMAIAPADRPRLLLIIDDYDELVRFHGDQIFNRILQDIQRIGRDRQVYVAVSAARIGYKGLIQDLYDLMATRVVLFMSNKDNLRTALGSSRVPFFTEAVPGRGFVLTRRGDIDEIQLMLPVPGLTETERQTNLSAAITATAQLYSQRP